MKNHLSTLVFVVVLILACSCGKKIDGTIPVYENTIVERAMNSGFSEEQALKLKKAYASTMKNMDRLRRKGTKINGSVFIFATGQDWIRSVTEADKEVTCLFISTYNFEDNFSLEEHYLGAFLLISKLDDLAREHPKTTIIKLGHIAVSNSISG